MLFVHLVGRALSLAGYPDVEVPPVGSTELLIYEWNPYSNIENEA
jgi:hypothetical protein